jgi:hypothetical protein
MFQNNNYSEFHKLSVQQQVSLDKHQEMINNATRWSTLPKAEERVEKQVVLKQLRLVWTTLMNFLMR